MNNSKEFLGTEPIGKLLFKLAVPSVIAQIVNMLYNIVDRIYIGHIPGSGSLCPDRCRCLPADHYGGLRLRGPRRLRRCTESVDLYGKR